jgi:hypothetical protein
MRKSTWCLFLVLLPALCLAVPKRHLVNSSGTSVAIDTDAICLGVIDIEHYEIHEGNHFTAVDYDTDTDAAGPKYIRFVTTNDTTPECHFLVRASASNSGFLEFYEAPVWTNNGTAITIYNNSRDNTTLPTAQVYDNPVATNDGNLVWVQVLGTDTAAPTGDRGELGDRGSEFILATNTEYAVKFTSYNDNTKLAVVFSWYEED